MADQAEIGGVFFLNILIPGFVRVVAINTDHVAATPIVSRGRNCMAGVAVGIGQIERNLFVTFSTVQTLVIGRQRPTRLSVVEPRGLLGLAGFSVAVPAVIHNWMTE